MCTDGQFPELRPWDKLVGINGDLADVIVGVLSWASISHSITVISLANFYSLFIQLSREFPDLIQDLHSVTRRDEKEDFLYSNRLCDSLEAAFQLGVRISGGGQHLEMPPQICQRNLERLRRRVGEAFVANLNPIGNRLAELLK